jgi:adenine-specific DNA methylase
MKTMMTVQKDKPVKKKSSRSLIKKEKTGDKDFVPPFTPAERKKMPKVSNMGSAKNGKAMKKSFPDLNKDGKITKADILKGRGVIAKRGASIKKAQDGTVSPKVMSHPKVKKMRDTHQQNLSNFKAKATKEREKTKETLRANLKKSKDSKNKN